MREPAYDRSSGQNNAPRAAGRARTGTPPGGGRVRDGGAHRRGARPRAPFAVPDPAAGPSPGPAPPRAGRVPGRIDPSLGAGCQARPVPWRADLTGRAEWRLDACGPGRQASPPRRRPAALGNGEGAHEVTARDHPAPAPAGLPLRQGRAALLPRAAQADRGLSPFPFPRRSPGSPAAAAGRAGAGLDAAGGAERPSSRTHGRAAPGNANRSRPAPRHPGRSTREPRTTRC